MRQVRAGSARPMVARARRHAFCSTVNMDPFNEADVRSQSNVASGISGSSCQQNDRDAPEGSGQPPM